MKQSLKGLAAALVVALGAAATMSYPDRRDALVMLSQAQERGLSLDCGKPETLERFDRARLAFNDERYFMASVYGQWVIWDLQVSCRGD